jgi:hypothetical protein
VWNHERFVAKMQREPLTKTTSRHLRSSGLTAMQHEPGWLRRCWTFCPRRVAAVRRLHRGPRGHSRASSTRAGRVLGLDRDPSARSQSRVRPWRHIAIASNWSTPNYRDLDRVLGHTRDCGSRRHAGGSRRLLDAARRRGRGFSFRRDEPLDMRMDQTSGTTAAEWLRTVDEEELANVILSSTARSGTRDGSRGRLVSARGSTPSRPPDSSPRSSACDPAPRLQRIDSGDANVSGAAHLGQPRARRPRRVSWRARRGGCWPTRASP